jgi:hypothetical protein
LDSDDCDGEADDDDARNEIDVTGNIVASTEGDDESNPAFSSKHVAQSGQC